MRGATPAVEGDGVQVRRGVRAARVAQAADVSGLSEEGAVMIGWLVYVGALGLMTLGAYQIVSDVWGIVIAVRERRR